MPLYNYVILEFYVLYLRLFKNEIDPYISYHVLSPTLVSNSLSPIK